MLSPKTRSLALKIAKKKIQKGFDKTKTVNDIQNREQSENGIFQKDVVGAEAPKREQPCGFPPVAHLRLPPRRFGGNMAYRSVDEDFWRSPHLLGLPFEVKAVYNYLITQGGTSGFVYRSDGEHTALLDLSVRAWEGACQTLYERGRVALDKPNRLIWVCNQLKWQYRSYAIISKNHDKGLRNELEGLPTSFLLAQFFERYKDRLLKDFPETMALLNPLLKGLPNPSTTLYQTHTQTVSQDHKDKETIPNQRKDKSFLSAKNAEGLIEEILPETDQTQKAIQNALLEKCRAANQEAQPSQLLSFAQYSALAYGRNGKKINCFGELDVVAAFLRSTKDQPIEDLFAYATACAKNVELVARFEKQVANAV